MANAAMGGKRADKKKRERGTGEDTGGVKYKTDKKRRPVIHPPLYSVKA